MARRIYTIKELKIRNSAQSDFMSKCIVKEMNNGIDQSQSIAICYSKWKEKNKK